MAGMTLYELIIELGHAAWKNGVNLSLIGTVLYLLLRHRKVKAKLKRHFPWMFANDSEVADYVTNQKVIIHNLKRLMEREGMEWNVPTLKQSANSAIEDKASYIHSTVASLAAQGAARRGIWSYTNSNMRRKKNMREYLKKLGRTKFQALIGSLIINGVSAYLFLSGTLDIDGTLNTWMPIINLTVGTISTWVYIIVEGGIDKANAGKEQPDDFETPIEPRL